MRRDAIATKQQSAFSGSGQGGQGGGGGEGRGGREGGGGRAGGTSKRKRLREPKVDMLSAAVKGVANKTGLTAEPSRSAAAPRKVSPPPVSSSRSLKRSTRTAGQSQRLSRGKNDPGQRGQATAAPSARERTVREVLDENARLRAQLKRFEAQARKAQQRKRDAATAAPSAVSASVTDTQSKVSGRAAAIATTPTVPSGAGRNSQLSAREQALQRAEEARLRDPQYLQMKKMLKEK